MKEENNDIIDVFLYPKYKKLTPLIPERITPNQLTLIGFFFGICAAVSLITISNKIGLLVSAFCLYLWSLFDSLDGIHARSKNNVTEFGAFLDHFLDAIAVLCLYSAVLYTFNLQQMVFTLTLALRLLISVTTYIVSSYVNFIFLPKIGPTCEQFLFILFFLLSYFFPGDVILFNSEWSFLKVMLGMQGISIMGLAMFILFLAAPLTVLEHFLIAKKNLT